MPNKAIDKKPTYFLNPSMKHINLKEGLHEQVEMYKRILDTVRNGIVVTDPMDLLFFLINRMVSF